MLLMRTKFAIIIVFVIVIFMGIAPLRAKAQDTFTNSNGSLTFDVPAESIEYQSEMPNTVAITHSDITVQRGPTTAN